MNKLFIVAIVSCEEGNIEIGTTVCHDRTEATLKVVEEYAYARSQATTEAFYDGYDSSTPYWYEVGNVTDKFWSRGEIQVKEV